VTGSRNSWVELEAEQQWGNYPTRLPEILEVLLCFFDSILEREAEMSNDAAQTTSIWMAEASSQSPLRASTHTDVCIVGAGISGMTTAYLLARRGKSVVVLNAGSIGGGETGRTSAHLSNALDDRYDELERLFGERGALLAAASHTAAIDCIEAIVAEERIACDFERLDGYLFVAPEESKDVLDREIGAVHRAGLTDVEWVDRAPLQYFDTGRCLRFPRQGQFHPLKYLSGLAQAIRREGGQIFTGTHAEEIQGGSPARIKTRAGPVVTADDVVVATNTPINDPLIMHTKQYAYRTYVIGVQIPRGSVTKALYWDTSDPYHYVRIHSGDDGRGQPHDLLIIGGEDHKVGEKGDGNQRFAELYRWTRKRFPMVQNIEYQWSGQILEPADSLAFIGRKPQGTPNVYIATGDSGHGLTHGTIAGILLTDLILGQPNPWACLYDPLRLRSIATTDFLVENLSVLVHYADWLTGGEVSSAEEIKPGEGRILRRGLTKIAAYRDENGVLHERQAICQHLGCVVSWNSTEKSWDCPCHGARYDALGRVINGPANRNLVGGDKS
jgi:glycine/D-amino acid oxidase-like deaminating enzyme/nitrite reductase/ring-hydroxylating ferredoxin subunit